MLYAAAISSSLRTSPGGGELVCDFSASWSKISLPAAGGSYLSCCVVAPVELKCPRTIVCTVFAEKKTSRWTDEIVDSKATATALSDVHNKSTKEHGYKGDYLFMAGTG